jgi:hypothetical protein
MPEVKVIRIAVAKDDSYGLVFGQLVENHSQVAVAMIDREGALLMADEAERQEGDFVLYMPDDAVFAVLEDPDFIAE